MLKFILNSIFSFFRLFPESWIIPLGRMGGKVFYFLLSNRRKIAVDNLTHAFPEKSDEEIKFLAKENFAHIGIMFMEFAILPKWKNQLKERVEISGLEILENNYKKGKGILLPVSHFGNWELAGSYLAEMGFRTVVVARPLNQTGVNDVVDGIRTTMGMEVLAKKEAVRGIIDALNEGAIVAVLVDQHGGKRGVQVDFFGRPVSMVRTIITVAKKTGAPIISGTLVRKGNSLKYKGVVENPIELTSLPDRDEEIQQNCQSLANLLEKQIRTAPDQWLWGHRRWRKLKFRGEKKN